MPFDDGVFSSVAASARRRLPRLFADYVDGGAHGEWTMARNRSAFRKWGIVPRGMKNVETVDAGVHCFGQQWKAPFMLAPVGFAGMLHPDREAGAARAALRCGVGMAVSTFAIDSMEKVAKVGGAPLAQIYVFRDRALTRDMLARAAQCGIDGIIVTVDTAITPVRERDVRNGFRHLSRPTLMQMAGLLAHPRWCLGMVGRGTPAIGNLAGYTTAHGIMGQAKEMAAQIDPTLDRTDLEWLRSEWKGQLVVKGVMHPEDARVAIEAGADGVIVSNHGGRQMDPAPATLDVLPQIAAAVAGKGDIVLDSGIRRGGDVVMALALGATAVSIGRPWAWALAAGGETSVENAIRALSQEVVDILGLAGLEDIAALRRRGPDALWEL
ncbi:alpha-hydroxy acid oxidase [Gluconobacter roseus]|uniref:Alpha-hydroxy-acid oxidizing enzyme n=1 Tax=Gluconobacter roseus NBRC 3990 TaxID=1307950 RepID=A0A4Y3MAV0_9PROT|nr:alpha-hydroxy acid oxidase [Gluconobacter roseus]KXV44409.1 oxidoreductase [Gluconobacter roseus]GEB03469.1 alpha-hydroxy-acid oxidizing enzyme [Gluconobacter roseus NBRC 3990]GLP93924.1 alpha-hydroxy-acid oxidizing enzyme [Gluconobacter roseus NBRC 3990]